MTIKKVEFTYKKSHLRYDSARKLYVGYQIDVRHNGKRLRNTFRTKGEAEAFIDALRKQKVYGKAGIQAPTGSVALSALFAKRLTKIKNPKEVTRCTRIFKLFEDIFDYPVDVTDVRDIHFQLYINSREGVKPETIDRELTCLSPAFKQARQMFPEELEGYKPPQIERPTYKKGKKVKGTISEREKDLMVQSIVNDRTPKEHEVRTISRPHVAKAFELAWLLGLRFSEVKRLLKTDFKPELRSLRVVRWKTGDVTIFEHLPDQVMELLLSLDSETEFIFDIPCSDHTFTAIVRDACKANGIPYGREILGGVTFHSTRHSFITRAIESGGDLPTVQAFSAHSDKEMVAYYSHASPEKKRQLMERMYPNGSGRLKEIYDQVKSGEMDFEAFLEALK